MEKRFGRHVYLYHSYSHLSAVREIVDKAEEAALYITTFAESMRWKLDFKEINRRRCASLPSDHPLCLIQPYLRARNINSFISNDETESSASSSDME